MAYPSTSANLLVVIIALHLIQFIFTSADTLSVAVWQDDVGIVRSQYQSVWIDNSEYLQDIQCSSEDIGRVNIFENNDKLIVKDMEIHPKSCVSVSSNESLVIICISNVF